MNSGQPTGRVLPAGVDSMKVKRTGTMFQKIFVTKKGVTDFCKLLNFIRL